MQQYTAPTIEIVVFDGADVIVASYDTDFDIEPVSLFSQPSQPSQPNQPNW